MPKLVGFVTVQTLAVNEVISVIIDVAGREHVSVSHELEADRAVGITAFEVLRIRLKGKAFGDSLSKLRINHIMLGSQDLRLDVIMVGRPFGTMVYLERG